MYKQIIISALLIYSFNIHLILTYHNYMPNFSIYSNFIPFLNHKLQCHYKKQQGANFTVIYILNKLPSDFTTI